MTYAQALQSLHYEWSFEDLLTHVLTNGEMRTDRTGTGTRSIFSPPPLVYSLRDSRVALITSKQVPWRMALREFLWMLSGSTNTNDLRKSSPAMATIWDNWADGYGNVGPTYGAQYRNAGGASAQDGRVQEYGVDQLAQVIDRLVKTPNTRRALVSLWSVPQLDQMALEPCMVLFHFSLRGEMLDQLELHVYQRSADLMLGVPFDLFQASFLAHAVARELSLRTGQFVSATKLIWTAGDAHIYENQVEPVKLQLAQARDAEPMRARMVLDPFPSLRLLDGTLDAGHVSIHEYNPMPPISGGPIAV